jgi:hypothetical protein
VQRFSDIIAIGALTLMFTVLSNANGAPPSSAPNASLLKLPHEAQVRFVVNELRRCPSWLDFSPGETQIRCGIVRICHGLEPLDTATLNEGVAEYWSEYCAIGGQINDPEILTENAAKVFLLVRVVFDVPERYPVSADMSVGPFMATAENLANIGQISLLWPLVKGPEGDLVIAGSNELGTYSGSPYDGVKDFAFMAKHFSRRPARLSPTKTQNP